MAGPVSPTYSGIRYPTNLDPTGGTIEVYVGGQLAATFDDATADLTLPTNGLVVTAGGIAVTAGGVTVTAGGLTVTAGGLTVTAGSISLPAGSVAMAALAEGSMRFIDTQLTNTQVLALATGAGEELIAAPGANKAIVVHSVYFVADAAAGAWVEPSAPDDLVVQYADGVDITGTIEGTALIGASVKFRKYGVVDTELVPDVNAAVMLFNTGGNWTGGNAANTFSVRIWHSVVDTVAFS